MTEVSTNKFVTWFQLCVVLVMGGLMGWSAHNWYRLMPGYAWDTLQVRCEQERKGVLIGRECFKKEALIWQSGGNKSYIWSEDDIEMVAQ